MESSEELNRGSEVIKKVKSYAFVVNSKKTAPNNPLEI